LIHLIGSDHLLIEVGLNDEDDNDTYEDITVEYSFCADMKLKFVINEKVKNC